MKTKLGIIAKDLVKSGTYGFLFALGFGLIVFGVAFFATDFQPLAALEAVRAALFIAGGCGMFLVAGLILSKKEFVVKNKDSWQKSFPGINFAQALAASCVAVIIAGIVLDYLLFAL